MLRIVSWFVITVITYILDSYVFSKLVNEKFYVNLKNIILLLVFSIFNCYISLNFNSLIKGIVTDLLIFFFLKILYNKSNVKTMVGTMFIYIGFVISELIFSLIFVFDVDSAFFRDDILGVLITNLSIFILFIVLFSIKRVTNFVKKLIEWTSEIKLINTVTTIILAVLLCFVFICPITFDKNIADNLIVTGISLIGIIMFIAGYFKEKSGNNKLSIEYNQLLDYVKTYEAEVIENSKKQHEYKNQLILIDDMIYPKNKKAKEYIKKLINDNSETRNMELLNKLAFLPKGGLKGFVYFKIQKMLEEKLDVYVEVDPNLSKRKIWNNCDDNLEDISGVLGVYLDNAIEAAVESKARQIIIEFRNLDDNIEFILSNTYNGRINTNKLDRERYSTKGKGRGYGLSLVKDIINKNDNLKQYREINGKFYVQKLLIKK